MARAAEALIEAVDIGGTKIAVGLVSAEGQVRTRRLLHTAHYADGMTACHAIARALRSCVDELEAAMCGIGIGCTGPVDPLTGTIGLVANLPR